RNIEHPPVFAALCPGKTSNAQPPMLPQKKRPSSVVPQCGTEGGQKAQSEQGKQRQERGQLVRVLSIRGLATRAPISDASRRDSHPSRRDSHPSRRDSRRRIRTKMTPADNTI